MKTTKKLLALVLSLALSVSVMSIGVFAADFSDLGGQSKKTVAAIEKWSDGGYEIIDSIDGAFKPLAGMSRVNTAIMLARLLNLEEEGDISAFTDIAGLSAEAKSALAKCYAAGIITGYSSTKMAPDKTINRAQYFTMLGRAFNFEQDASGLEGFEDAASVPKFARGYMGTLVSKGYVKGVGDNKLAPAKTLNRAQAVRAIDQTVAVYANEDNATVELSDKGVTLVVADNVTVTGTGVDLVVAAAADDADYSAADAGDVYLLGESIEDGRTALSDADEVIPTTDPTPTSVTQWSDAAVNNAITAINAARIDGNVQPANVTFTGRMSNTASATVNVALEELGTASQLWNNAKGQGFRQVAKNYYRDNETLLKSAATITVTANGNTVTLTKAELQPIYAAENDEARIEKAKELLRNIKSDDTRFNALTGIASYLNLMSALTDLAADTSNTAALKAWQVSNLAGKTATVTIVNGDGATAVYTVNVAR